EAQARLFKPFSQADNSTTRKYGGTGLGLVICKQLVERMSGEIGVRSAAGDGSTFWFTVRLEKQPVARGPAQPDDLADLRVLIGGGSSAVHFHRRCPGNVAAPAPAPIAAKVLRILVAEDNAVNQKVAVRQLEKLGYAVVDVAANGLEAIDALKRSAYHVVLMDCQMPELDGYEATRRIRQFSSADKAASSAAVHIIAMTANTMEGDRELCLTAGMDDYIAKPMRMEQLQAALEKVVL